MSEKGFVTKGSAEYFAEREARITAHIDDAKGKIAEIEARVRGEIAEISARRDRIREHLRGFVEARNELVLHRARTIALVQELEAVVAVCDAELPGLDKMLDSLDAEYVAEDTALDGAEKSRARQIHKHERKRTRYELRKCRLDLRKRLALGDGEKSAAQSEEKSA